MNCHTLLKPALTAFLWIFVPVSMSAQIETHPPLPVEQVVISDALQQLAKTRDTARIDLLLQISEELLKSHSQDAFGYAQEALIMAEELKDTYRSGLAFRAMAGVYTVTAVYDKALDYLLMALSKFNDLNDTLEMATCYNEIGVLHMSSGDFAEAQMNYKKALALNIKSGNPASVARNYMNMGLNYLGADSVNKGLSYFLISLMIADSLNMEPEKVILLKNIGLGYARLGRYEDALNRFYKVIELLGEQPDDLTLAEAQVNIALGYFNLKNYPAALKYASDGYTLAKSRRFNLLHRDASKVLSDIYAVQENYKLAYQYNKEYRDISDTLLNSQKTEQLARIRILYDVNLKEKENIRLRQQNFLNIKRMRSRTLGMVMITLLVIVLATLLYTLNRMNNRYRVLNKKLAAQSSELETLNDVKDKFFTFVAHNLRNPFNTIMGFSDLMKRAADAHDLEKARQYSGLIHDLSGQVQKVLSNLLEWSRLQRRTFEVKSETVELTGLIKDVVEMNNKEAARKDIDVRLSGESNVFVVADRTMITTVIQNLVTNAIHFTPPSGHIFINCSVKDQCTEVSITDTGVGISPENLKKLFDFDCYQEKTGLTDQGGSGLGLVICHEMMLKNGGAIKAESDPGKGSCFTLTLPLVTRHDTGMEDIDIHMDSTPEDIVNELLSSRDAISENMLDDFRETLVPAFEEVSKVLSIENLGRFARTVTTAGERNHIASLTSFGKSINTLTIGHQIDQIIKILPRFREYLRKINAYVE